GGGRGWGSGAWGGTARGRSRTGAASRDRAGASHATPGTSSVEQVGLLADDAGVERLEAQPAGGVHAHLAGRALRVLAVDEHRGARRLGHELGLARALHGDEPPGGLVDAVPDSEQTVVAQDHRLALTERVGDPLAVLEVEHGAGVVVEERLVAVGGARVL